MMNNCNQNPFEDKNQIINSLRTDIWELSEQLLELLGGCCMALEALKLANYNREVIDKMERIVSKHLVQKANE